MDKCVFPGGITSDDLEQGGFSASSSKHMVQIRKTDETQEKEIQKAKEGLR